MRNIIMLVTLLFCVFLFTACCGCGEKSGPTIQNSGDQPTADGSHPALSGANTVTSDPQVSTSQNSQSTNDCGCGK